MDNQETGPAQPVESGSQSQDIDVEEGKITWVRIEASPTDGGDPVDYWVQLHLADDPEGCAGRARAARNGSAAAARHALGVPRRG